MPDQGILLDECPPAVLPSFLMNVMRAHKGPLPGGGHPAAINRMINEAFHWLSREDSFPISP